MVRDAVGKYFGSLIQTRFDVRLEKLRSELRISEERFSSLLRESERRLDALATTTVALRSSRQTALDARRLLAVEKLWAAKIATDRLKITASFVSTLNLEELKKGTRHDPAMQQLGEALEKMSGLEPTKLPEFNAAAERPFLPTEVWALFSAYQNILLSSAIVLQTLKAGLPNLLTKQDPVKPVVLVALPEYRNYIEEFGFRGYYHLLDILEQKLLTAISRVLDGDEYDERTLKRTAELIAAAKAIHESKLPDIPDELKGPEIPEPNLTRSE